MNKYTVVSVTWHSSMEAENVGPFTACSVSARVALVKLLILEPPFPCQSQAVN